MLPWTKDEFLPAYCSQTVEESSRKELSTQRSWQDTPPMPCSREDILSYQKSLLTLTDQQINLLEILEHREKGPPAMVINSLRQILKLVDHKGYFSEWSQECPSQCCNRASSQAFSRPSGTGMLVKDEPQQKAATSSNAACASAWPFCFWCAWSPNTSDSETDLDHPKAGNLYFSVSIKIKTIAFVCNNWCMIKWSFSSCLSFYHQRQQKFWLALSRQQVNLWNSYPLLSATVAG